MPQFGTSPLRRTHHIDLNLLFEVRGTDEIGIRYINTKRDLWLTFMELCGLTKRRSQSMLRQFLAKILTNVTANKMATGLLLFQRVIQPPL